MTGAAIQADVDAALREVGRELGAGAVVASLIRQVDVPANPWDAQSTTVALPIVVMVERFDQRLVDGTLIQAEDRRVMASALGAVPTTADRLSVPGDGPSPATEYAILSVTPEAPGGIALYYVLHCRK